MSSIAVVRDEISVLTVAHFAAHSVRYQAISAEAATRMRTTRRITRSPPLKQL